MNRRALLATVVAGLVAGCRSPRKEPAAPIDGLMKDAQQLGVDLAGPDSDTTEVWFVRWGDGAVHRGEIITRTWPSKTVTLAMSDADWHSAFRGRA